MSTGTWNPESGETETSTPIDGEIIRRFVALGDSDQLGDLKAALSDADKSQHDVMLASASQWQDALQALDSSELIALIRFFTVVEMQLDNWQGGPDSPVIKINNLLKQRGEKLDKDMLLWIRQQSTNRYIPNGAVL